MAATVLEVAPARPDESLAVQALLERCGLPVAGLSDHFSNAVVARRGERIVGCVALELYGRIALLRSLAVVPEERGTGIGERLTNAALDLGAREGIDDVYLLTETAERFFPRFGFAEEERSSAPAALQQSEEFRSACPASAVMMRRRLASP